MLLWPGPVESKTGRAMTDTDDDWQETYEHERGERRACLVAKGDLQRERCLAIFQVGTRQ